MRLIRNINMRANMRRRKEGVGGMEEGDGTVRSERADRCVQRSGARCRWSHNRQRMALHYCASLRCNLTIRQNEIRTARFGVSPLVPT